MKLWFALLVVVALAVSACSGSVNFSFGGQSVAEAAVDLIEGSEMAQRLGVAPITGAVCDDPPDQAVGTVFACTAASDGQTIDFEVLIEEDDRIFAGPTNVIDPAGIDRLEIAAVRSLNNANDFGLPEDSLDCGDGGTILDDDREFICQLTDPENGDVFDAQVTITNVASGSFDIEVLGETVDS